MPKITDPVKKEIFRQKMREIALKRGLGKDRKGKTYEEIYGKKRAKSERRKRVEANKIAKLGKDFSRLRENSKKIAEQRKGKSYLEIYGEKKSQRRNFEKADYTPK